MPLIFALAAKLEDVPLSNFVINPTKMANSVVAVYQRLRPDGVTCYFDQGGRTNNAPSISERGKAMW